MTDISPRKYWWILGAILVFAFLTRVYRLAVPTGYMFDEVYHAMTAKLVLHNDPRAYEWWVPPPEPATAVEWLHPPLAKYFQAAGMALFGENSFGWRISSVVFGVLVIAATAELARLLFGRRVALFAAALASLDGLLLVQSRIAMNDIHVTFFILLTLICYVRYRSYLAAGHPRKWWWLFVTALSAGLAMASKWSGIFVLITVVGWEIILSSRARARDLTKSSSSGLTRGSILAIARQYFSMAIILLLLPPIIYLLSYWQMFAQGKSLVCTLNHVQQGQCYCVQESSWWVKVLGKVGVNAQPWEARGGCMQLISHFGELNQQIWWYQTHLNATHPYQSRPWQWFLDWRPVWYATASTMTESANIYAFGNPLLFWFGDLCVIGTAGWLLLWVWRWTVSRKRVVLPASLNALALLLSAYAILWMPWFFSPRIMFFYHYTPAVPLMAIIVSYWMMKMSGGLEVKKKLANWRRFLPWLLLLALATVFVLWYPHWTQLPVPASFAERVYFFLPNWK